MVTLDSGGNDSTPTDDGIPPDRTNTYPIRFWVEYPDRNLNRLSTALRIFWAIPILIVLSAIGTYAGDASSSSWAGSGASLIFFAPLLMILFRRKYPRWWWDFNVELIKFQSRIGMYLALTSDRYPSTDEEQSVHIEADYPDVQNDLNRWLPLIKWFLAIPHYIVLFVLYILAFFVLIYVWIAIIVTGRYPRGAFNFIVGVSRWALRVEAYALLLSTDKYPPFSLE